MTHRLIYIVGAPGAGKSTALRHATAHLAKITRPKPFAHRLLIDPDADASHLLAVELGADHDTFPGTDRLSMAVQPVALRWLTNKPAPLVIGEGDRLGTLTFLAGARNAGYDVTLVELDAPPALAETRAQARGSNQSPSWRAGRLSKVRRLCHDWTGTLVTLDATQPVAAIAEQLRAVTGL